MSRVSAGEVIAWSAALVLGGLVALTVLFSGDATYAQIVRPDQEKAELHRGWVAYVTGRSGAQPGGSGAFTALERAHMADVRTVFIAAQIAAVLAAGVLLWLALRAWRRGALARLVRAGAMSSLVSVAVVGILAAVAFDAAFLLFHQIFFPQGNFLFAPDSNLLAIYPESYFYGVTLRIGASFVALAALLAAVSHVAVRRRSASA